MHADLHTPNAVCMHKVMCSRAGNKSSRNLRKHMPCFLVELQEATIWRSTEAMWTYHSCLRTTLDYGAAWMFPPELWSGAFHSIPTEFWRVGTKRMKGERMMEECDRRQDDTEKESNG
ncbi:uncharacterized protein LOC142557553 isoform X2 [Dermacentor variabilis]|uniref:uncharacterized protein LOC142557553 isoform X2 n=1 Tax=Dermacentor variabilis TaxID=34621 RepID=UPI003F5C2011